MFMKKKYKIAFLSQNTRKNKTILFYFLIDLTNKISTSCSTLRLIRRSLIIRPVSEICLSIQADIE